jgi:hypothetical protein
LVQTTVSVSTTEYSCLGDVPENATICPDNNLEYDEYATLTDFCSPLRNCEYTCNQGYTRNANVCVRTSLPVKPDFQTNVDDLLSLNKGWNMVIFPEGEYNGVRIKKNYLESPFELLNVLEIWKYEESSRCFNEERDRSCLSVFPFKKGYGFLGSIKKNEAYWVYSSEDRIIETCDINKDNCIIPVIDNYKSVNRSFNRGFNFVNFGELNYLIEKIGNDSEISFYILNWDPGKSEWQTRNNKGGNDIDYSKLEIFDQGRAYLIYIKDEFIVSKIDKLLEIF